MSTNASTPTPARPALDAMAMSEGDEPTPEAILIAAWKLRFNKAFRPEEEAAALMAFLDTVGLCVVSKRALADMRGALEETRINLELVERPKFKDPDHGAEVEALGERIGYGALMSSAQASWRASNARRGFPDGGEFVAGPCYATVMKNLEMVRTALGITPHAKKKGKANG